MRWIAVALLSLLSLPALAVGVPVDGAFGFQPAASPLMEEITSFHNILLWVIIPVTIFVLALLIIVVVKYNAKANKVPSKFSHNTTIEVIWTGVPVLILLVIAFFSFPLLYKSDQIPDVDESEIVNVKAQGNQWNWTYTYTDVIVDDYPVEFVSNPLHRGLPGEPAGTADAPRNLAVDLPMVVPVDTVVRVQTAASDVIHSFAVPAFGVKTDAVPGRLNELWFRANQTGTFYGQCSELCGKDHAFMPIEIRVVTQPQYEAWLERVTGNSVEDARQYLAEIANESPVQLASVQ